MSSSTKEEQKESSSTRHNPDLHAAEKAILPYYHSPFSENAEFESVHLRHQSNLIELFFDLFLSADLATFTAAHSIVDKKSLIAYLGFFLIIWSTWFQITLHDIRFAQDSVYERVCKVFQFLTFVSFALVGADFSPEVGTENERNHPDLNFWILSFTLFFSRAVLAAQYAIALFARTRPVRLKLPLALNAFVFLVSGFIFIGFTSIFTRAKYDTGAGSSIAYVTWYLVLLFELAAVLQISHVWKEISFAATHLTERMGLLTLIVIGEGAIGASKTTIEMMGRRTLEVEPILLVICIILILALLWILYFDNLPTGHHGSTWQQGWAILHLPLHLSFVGILEGSRQAAMMRFISQALHGFVANANKLCLVKHLDGKVLGDSLLHLVDAYDFGILHPTADEYIRMRELINEIENIPGVCSISGTIGVDSVFDMSKPSFVDFKELLYGFATALFISDGAEDVMPPGSKDAFALLERSVITIYLYYWSSVLVALLTLMILYRLSHPRKYHIGDYFSTAARVAMALLAVGLVALYADRNAWINFIASRAMLPTLTSILAFVVIGDRVGRLLRRRELRKIGVGKPEDIEGENKKAKSESIKSRRRGIVLSQRSSVYNWLMPAYERDDDYIQEAEMR